MLKLPAIALAIFSFVACNNAGSGNQDKDKKETTVGPVLNKLTDQEKADGWELLFDGETTKGWHQYGGAPVGEAWHIMEGALCLDTAIKENGKIKGDDITTDQEYENFDLKLDWKISPKGNSGIIFYVKEDTTIYKRPYETGPEMQVLDNDGHEDGQYPKHRAGDLYDLVSCSKETVKPVGEWNQAEIKCVNGKLDFYLNGENVVSTSLWDDNWKKLISESKFKQWPGFGTFKKGRIDLQNHGSMVCYRNIRIKRL